MGRAKPSTATRRDEELLARAVSAAVATVQSSVAPDTTDGELARAVKTVVAEVDAVRSGAGEATGLVTTSLVALDDLEITQQVQDLAHTVPLIAGRSTVVRAYLSHAVHSVRVRGELLVSRSLDGPWTAVPSLAPADIAPDGPDLRVRRADLTRSLNFRLPDDMTEVGDTFVRLGDVRRADRGDLLPSVAGIPVRQVTFREAAPLRLRLVRFRYSMPGSSVVHEPSATDLGLIASWLRRAYPISELRMTTVTAPVTAPAPFGAFQVNAQLAAMRAADVLTGTDARTHYYGLVADSGFFMRGFATGVPAAPEPDTVASGPAGPGTFGWDEDGSYGDWYGAHELAHTFGRPHAEFCGAVDGAPYPFPNGQLSDADEAFVGLDVGDSALGLPMRALRGTVCHDVMSYCDRQWISSFTYRAIYDRLLAEDALPAGGPTTGPGPETATAAGTRLIAAVDLTTGYGAITAVLPAGDGGPSDVGDGRLSVRILDRAGAVLDERPVPFRRSVVEEPGDVTGLVDVVLPQHPGASEIELLLDGTVLDSCPAGGEPGRVGPSTGPFTPGAEVEMRRPVTDGRRYVVQLSGDGGGSWATVAVGLTEPTVTIRPGDVAGESVLARVLATSGSGVTVVRTDSVQLS